MQCVHQAASAPDVLLQMGSKPGHVSFWTHHVCIVVHTHCALLDCSMGCNGSAAQQQSTAPSRGQSYCTYRSHRHSSHNSSLVHCHSASLHSQSSCKEAWTLAQMRQQHLCTGLTGNTYEPLWGAGLQGTMTSTQLQGEGVLQRFSFLQAELEKVAGLELSVLCNFVRFCRTPTYRYTL